MRKRAKSNKELITGTVVPPDSNFSGLERINSIPNYSTKIKENFLADIIFQYSLMSPKELIKASKDDKLTVLERQVIVQLVDSLSKSKGASQSRSLSHDRIAGKATNKIEHSGPNGAPIELSQAESNAKFDAAIENMSDKELALYEKAVKALDKLRNK